MTKKYYNMFAEKGKLNKEQEAETQNDLVSKLYTKY